MLLPVRTVGVMGDGRTYENVCALRAVTSVDGMTADFYPYDMSFLGPRRDPHHQRGQGRQPRRLRRHQQAAGDDRVGMILALPRVSYSVPETSAARRMRSADKRLGRGLPRSCPSLGPLRARGKADRLRGLSPTLAFQPRHDGRAHHRPQAGHGRHVGRRLPQAHAGDRTLSGTLAGAHADVSVLSAAGAFTC